MIAARYRMPLKTSRCVCICLVSVALPLIAAASRATAADSQDSPAVTLGDDSLFAGIPGEGPLEMAEIERWLMNPEIHKPLNYELPLGLQAAKQNIFVPENNPITRAKIELGRQLYFDTRLSADESVSCASCHDPGQGFAAETQFGVGIRDQEGGRNSPVAYNRILSREQFWDGRASTLEDQAIGPIANPIEMGNQHDACVACLEGIPGYKKQFEAIFEDGVTIMNVGKALATFERAIVTGPAPYDYQVPLDRFREVYADDLEDLEELREEDPEFVKEYEELVQATKDNPMSESALNGMKLFFGKANCKTCHAGANFTDEQYHNLGVGMTAETPDLGRYEITKVEAEKGAFKTPTLRNIAASKPYMHDGSQETLEEVMEWYNKGGHPNPWLSDKMKKLDLTDQEVADVVAFMKEGLTGSFPKIEPGRLPK
ncbi:Cytochrome c551 peroxidase precursor [Roseimaritima ulvae]|uniref:Cytochrome c551 peroxidase n=2 Tax=Roseimaritima ulvae TaxID=980254 RepID=A0A5B9QP91_9BACT|nr:Cytochrome c551 peroxidase precursor [Roseimaritima ulvae]